MTPGAGPSAADDCTWTQSSTYSPARSTTWGPPTPEQSTALAQLREPFPADAIEQIEVGGRRLDYVSHARVRARLLDADPCWWWESVAATPEGEPLITRDGDRMRLWILLHVAGRPPMLGVGTCRADQREPEKELIGDALRNAAMSLGVALDLWMRHRAAQTSGPAATTGEQTLDDAHIRGLFAAGHAVYRKHGTTGTSAAIKEVIQALVEEGGRKGLRDVPMAAFPALKQALEERIGEKLAALGAQS